MAQPYGSRYEIVEKIARGGMADVFKARDLLLDRSVALKVLFPELSTSDAFVERFRREATAAANLSHPNIVSVFDWGKSENSYFIVMELVEGQTLSALIKNNVNMGFEHAAAIASDVASALGYAHRHGVVHRDIKPGNVLITNDGHIKVTDFGIARAQSASSEDLTQTGSVMGTASYISPEQAESRSIDGRSDIYSLGIVLFEMICGQPPFRGESAVSVAMKHVNEPPPAIETLRPGTPQPLINITMKALSKDPSDRYATAQDFRADLLRFIQGRPVEAGSVARAGEATAVFDEVVNSRRGFSDDRVPEYLEATTVIPLAPSQPNKKRENLGTIIAIAGAVVVLAAFFLVYSLVKSNKLATPTTTTLPAISVPSVVGDPVNTATSTLSSQGLTYKISYQQSSSVANGTVLSQDPAAGSQVTKGSSITVQVSSGAALVTLPNVVNQTIGNAESQLVPLGFSISTTYVNSSTPNGTVIKQSPVGGGKAPQGSTIDLTVSNGPAQVSVPDVSGQPSAQAANALGTAGLSLGNTTNQASDTVPSGDVISTNPPAGTQVAPNSSVDLVISSGPTSTTTTAATTTTSGATTTTSAGGSTSSSTTTTAAG